MTSFSANRQGRPRPCDISFQRRRSQEEKAWPSPSFNSTMSLGKVDDVFFDPSKSIDRLRNSYLSVPATPSSLIGSSSPDLMMERLPSLSDLFNKDILSPVTPAFTMRASISDQGFSDGHRPLSSSGPMGRSRYWGSSSSFSGTSGTSTIGPPATPLSPYFGHGDATPIVSPRSTFPAHPSTLVSRDGPESDPDHTPKATSRATFETLPIPASPSLISPRCPGAPYIGVGSRQHFEIPSWSPRSTEFPSIGTFQGIRASEGHQIQIQRPSVVGGSSGHEADIHLTEKDGAVKLDRNMPRVKGLSGLGIHITTMRSPIRSPTETMHGAFMATIGGIASSPTTGCAHTGLTPMVNASKIREVASTPTRSKVDRAEPRLSSVERSKLKGKAGKSSPPGTKRAAEPVQTPLKSRPMFRLDTGSGKRASRPKGHNMNPDASPWGVFGAKDGWKPLAPPNVARALHEANKQIAAAAASSGSDDSLSASRCSGTGSTPKGKRDAQSCPDSCSPSKRMRPSLKQANGLIPSPAKLDKENAAPPCNNVSPSKRSRLFPPPHHQKTTAMPLSTVR
ncbi:hypothetical protein BCV70DRAFT_168613 [Testicularia cyperi]|uniref:Uncharacterized protein n=1 Tax=Testicularia cyperi TaxID=1882483 RepID=A0A317XZB2_9BASI|nr:hypothetical protein BCV70DRAFT_168613 [Testicularia cyperi]